MPVTVPLLTIFGERDALIPASAAANLGASTIIPQAGHLPHLSAPDAVFEHIEHFLELQRYRLDKSALFSISAASPKLTYLSFAEMIPGSGPVA